MTRVQKQIKYAYIGHRLYMHDASNMIFYGTIFLTYTDMTTTEPQGTGRKRGHSDPEGADSEPGKCQLISAAHLQCMQCIPGPS